MVTNRNFSTPVPLVAAGSPITAANTNQSAIALTARTNYLQEVIEQQEAGHALIQRHQHLHAEVVPGQAVYWNANAQHFAPATAALLTTNDAQLQVAESAYCVGICLKKHNATSGDIAIIGAIWLDDAQIAILLAGDRSPGMYYLSAAVPGQLTKQAPAVTMAVAYVLGPLDSCTAGSWVILNPHMKNFLENHVHQQYNLVARPAGDHIPPAAEDTHVILNPDVALPGWLPANHSSFAGAAPPGAKFGYNLQAHPELRRNWPPIPVGAAVLELQKTPLGESVTEIYGYTRVPAAYVTLDAYGIWWMTDCYNQVPWNTLLDTTTSASSSSETVSSASSAAVPLSSSSASQETNCPVLTDPGLILSFLKMTFLTDRMVVTSLQAETGQPIAFVSATGTASNTGDLYARLDIAASVNPTPVAGGYVIKHVADDALRFDKGWVTEGLVAGSDEVLLSSTQQTRANPALPVSVSNPVIHQGVVTITIQLDPTERELNPQIVKLGDAVEREYANILYLGFPSGRNSAIQMRYNIPTAGLPSNAEFRIRALLFGRATGPFSAMTLSYKRLVRPTAGTPTPIVGADTALTFDVVTPSDDIDGAGTNLPLDNLIEVESDTLTISPGDTLFVTLSRAATATPLYQSEIGVVRVGGIILPGT